MVKYVKDFEFSSSGPKLVRGYMRGGSCSGYAKGGATKAPVGAVKIGVVMKEFGKGKLHIGSDKGPLVKNPKQAIAIGISEARDAGAKIPVKKQMGGLMAKPGMGAMTDAEAKRAAGRSMSYLSPKGKASLAKAPTRAQYDAMMAAQAAADAVRSKPAGAMTPAERARISGGEGVDPKTGKLFGRPYKKGGSAKC